MRDLPDRTQQRRYSHRPTINRLQGNSRYHNDATMTRTESITEEESPSIVVESLFAAWSGKVRDYTFSFEGT